ncbi:MAG TPA: phytanoyl-CoA dioxygenase family protein [Terriglobales bacterium]|nr:phytanoyl-CoA dioxygenase family protein [Terriglobales bacterium]
MTLATENSVQAFAHQGYCTLAARFSPDEMDEVCNAFEGMRRSRAGIRHVLSHPAVASFAGDLRLMDLAREILGPDASPFRATLFDKSPDANWLVAWHQDTALPLAKKRDIPGWTAWSCKDGVHYAHAPASALQQVVAIRVHLDDSTLENGPLRVLPGTHQRGVLADDEVHALASEIEPVTCTVDRGGLVLMHPLLIHASSKCTSSQSRRVLHIEYASSRTLDGITLALC